MISRSTLSRLCIVGARNRFGLIPTSNGVVLDGSAPTALPQLKTTTAQGHDSRFCKDFSFVDILGRGSFGIVCSAVNRLDLQLYAVKCVPFDERTQNVFGEIRAMAKLPPHENIIRYFSCWKEAVSPKFCHMLNENMSEYLSEDLTVSNTSTPTEFTEVTQILYIQMELCQDNLRSWLKDRKAVDALSSLNVLFQLINGLLHMHQHGVLHLDVKPENCFRNGALFKFGDFGSSYTEGDAPSDDGKYLGTGSYAAPECEWGKSQCSSKTDVFSLGLCLMELFDVFSTGMARALLFSGVRSRDTSMPWSEQWPSVSNMVFAMTNPIPEDRPTLVQTLEWCCVMAGPSIHPSFKSLSPQGFDSANEPIHDEVQGLIG
uniref:non-specific serine/threonine protein kinase n=1 Tax=Spongospora subterranea TaxID=70186 RepID=A0A0H5R852_9EUKA|eukprot:CRZ10303.1 hypothetical protein [Spongospora subterranea]